MEKNKFKFSKWFVDRYLVHGLSGMAFGLFATLIVGLIIKQIGELFGDNIIGTTLTQFGNIATAIMGVGIGVGVAHDLKAPKLVMYSSVLTGLLGAHASSIINGKMFMDNVVVLNGPGDPLGAFIAAVVGLEVGRLISGKTKLDIVLTPIVTILAGGAIALLLGPALAKGTTVLGQMIIWATERRPFIMGILVSTFMGIILTLPISSAAIAIIFKLTGLAAGAATVGCSTQMIGFAVASYRENKMNGLVAQGLGTSMLQIPNIIKNPRIWIPPIISSAILGPISTIVFKMENNQFGAGMGTSGLVGQIMTWQTMSETTQPVILLIKILLLHIILPALLTLGISEVMRKSGLIKRGDMKLDL